jgi:hypothetical protein
MRSPLSFRQPWLAHVVVLWGASACFGGGSSQPKPPVSETGADSGATDTGSGPITETGLATSATGHTGTASTAETGLTSTGDTGNPCGPGEPADCFLYQGTCVDPTEYVDPEPLATDSWIDSQLANGCGPEALVLCPDVNVIVHYEWQSETPGVAVFDATTREGVGKLFIEDDGEGCETVRFVGQPAHLECVWEALVWGGSAYNLGCDPWDGEDDTCENDLTVCVRDDVPR